MTMESLRFVEDCLHRSSDLRVVAVSIVVLMVLTHFIFRKSILRKDQKEVPEPPALPIIGHLHLFGTFPHQRLMKLARQHGPLMAVRLGTLRYIVASSAEMAKEFLKTQDAVWASRPHTLFSEQFFYNCNSAILQPQNDYWRKMRKIYISELLAPTLVEKQKDQRHESLMRMVNSLIAVGQSEEPIELDSYVCDMNFYHITKLLFGRNFSADDGSTSTGGRKSLRQVTRELSNIDFLSLGECFPYLKWLDLDRAASKMKKLHAEYDVILTDLLEKNARQEKGEESRDFSRVLLSMLDREDGEGLSLNTVKGSLTDILVAGIETTASTISFVVSEILKHPEVKQKLVQELNDVVGSERLVKEVDLVNLKYLKMVLKESLRLHPVVPLLVTHMSTAPSVIAGYHFPANTPMFVNVYAIQRDPDLWEDPLTFKPERFLESPIDVRGQHFELLPFGSGRRMCPGMNMGMAFVGLVIAQVFHTLDIQLPPGMKPEDVDLTERTGAATCLANPLKVVVSPRLAKEFYRQ